MKHILEIGVYKPGSFRLEVVDVNDLQVTVNENTAVFIGRSTVTRHVNGHDYSDSYRIGKAYLKQHEQWRMVVSERARVPREIRVENRTRKAAA